MLESFFWRLCHFQNNTSWEAFNGRMGCKGICQKFVTVDPKNRHQMAIIDKK